MDHNECVFLIMGLFFGFLVGMVLVLVVDGISIEELGQSICDQEYGLDFESYINKVLNCKPKEISYNGISVNIGGE